MKTYQTVWHSRAVLRGKKKTYVKIYMRKPIVLKEGKKKKVCKDLYKKTNCP